MPCKSVRNRKVRNQKGAFCFFWFSCIWTGERSWKAFFDLSHIPKGRWKGKYYYGQTQNAPATTVVRLSLRDSACCLVSLSAASRTLKRKGSNAIGAIMTASFLGISEVLKRQAPSSGEGLDNRTYNTYTWKTWYEQGRKCKHQDQQFLISEMISIICNVAATQGRKLVFLIQRFDNWIWWWEEFPWPS